MTSSSRRSPNGPTFRTARAGCCSTGAASGACATTPRKPPANSARRSGNRNYESDADGQWFFQNGPQRVYVELVYTPWIVRLHAADGALRLIDQGGAPFEPAHVWIDDAGGILLSDDASPARIAALHDHDLELFADHASLDDAGTRGVFHWRDGVDLTVQPIARADVAARFGFVASPAERAAAKKD